MPEWSPTDAIQRALERGEPVDGPYVPDVSELSVVTSEADVGYMDLRSGAFTAVGRTVIGRGEVLSLLDLAKESIKELNETYWKEYSDGNDDR